MGRIIDVKCIFYGENLLFSPLNPHFIGAMAWHGNRKAVQNEEGMFLCNNVDCAMRTTRLTFKNFIFLENNGIWLL
jgi:hypothetical protein